MRECFVLRKCISIAFRTDEVYCESVLCSGCTLKECFVVRKFIARVFCTEEVYYMSVCTEDMHCGSVSY